MYLLVFGKERRRYLRYCLGLRIVGDSDFSFVLEDVIVWSGGGGVK